MIQNIHKAIAPVLAAIAFYTVLPVPASGSLKFERVSRLAPIVGILVGGLLGLLDTGLQALGMPNLSRSVGIVLLWVGITGGLHLDGAMDTADGLAVLDPPRRLQVMADSHSGAFGVMAAIALLLLKTAALSELSQSRWLLLVLAAGWGRWGQQVAIARYPYLKPTGKGAFHKAALPSLWYTVPGLLLLLGASALPTLSQPEQWIQSLTAALSGGAIALLAAAWFHQHLGGHTGDTYGAVVEWTEALYLLVCTMIW